MAVVATWDAADASGIRNVFRNLFDVPIGAFTTPPLLSITFDASGNPGGGGTPPLPPEESQFIATAISGATSCAPPVWEAAVPAAGVRPLAPPNAKT